VVQHYENVDFGISLDRPSNWSLEFYERSGSIVLEATGGLWNKDSARIEVFGYACVPQQFDDPIAELTANIERIGALYNLDSATVIQEPVTIFSEQGKVAEATILVPTISLPEDSVINQVGDSGAEIFQIIDMIAVRDGSNHSVMVYVYRGNDEALNNEAHAVVDSIVFLCSE
jgi:hypothetical protein